MQARRNVTVGSALQLVVRIAGMLAGALVAALQARTLSVADFGTLSLILSVNAMAIILSDLGIMSTAIRNLARRPEDRDKIISGLLVSRLMLGVSLFCAGVAVVAPMLGSREGVWTSVVVLASLPLGSLTATQAISQARLHFAAVNTLLVLQNFLWLGAVALLSTTHAELIWFGVAFVLCAVVQSIVTWALCGRGLRFQFRLGLREAWPLLKLALPLGLGSVAVTAYYRLTGMVLFASKGADVAGNFSAAFRFLDALQAIPATLSGAFMPLMSRSFADQDERRAGIIWRLAMKLLLSSAVLVAVTVALLSDDIVQIMYGERYSAAGSLLQILMIAFPLVCIGWLLTGVVIASGKVIEYAGLTVTIAFLSVGSSMLTVPIWGAAASAWITVITELITVIGLAVLVRRSTSLRFETSIFVRILAAAICTAAAVLLSRPFGLLIAVIALLITVPTSVIAFRVITVSDARVLLKKVSVE